jgi:hypothetical protein
MNERIREHPNTVQCLAGEQLKAILGTAVFSRLIEGLKMVLCDGRTDGGVSSEWSIAL